MMKRSLIVPGSLSSALHTTYFTGSGCFRTRSHFMLVGKPAPPIPRSSAALSCARTSSHARDKAAELRGMGGAGFPTSMKWDLVQKQPDPVKYVVCNADESEPGTIKDRFIMTHLPHLVIEGMMIAGVVTGAKRGILYIRHEYAREEEILGGEIGRCYRLGLLGKRILSSEFDFDLEVFVSPGGYICGEESALLEAIEGHRAEPRNKPPFPGQIGLWQKPTVINNVETFINVPQILARGVDWFVAQESAGR